MKNVKIFDQGMLEKHGKNDWNDEKLNIGMVM